MSAERNGVERTPRIDTGGTPARIDSGGTPPRIAQCGHAQKDYGIVYKQKEGFQMTELKTGITNTVSAIVDNKKTAVSVGSGGLQVLATPEVAALAEKAAYELLQPYMADGITTVGTMINLDHISSTPVGAEFTATAELTAVADRKYTFSFTVKDNAGVIASGTHERFSVKTDRFMEKTNAKLGK